LESDFIEYRVESVRCRGGDLPAGGTARAGQPTVAKRKGENIARFWQNKIEAGTQEYPNTRVMNKEALMVV
jgi:hypothetical protein